MQIFRSIITLNYCVPLSSPLVALYTAISLGNTWVSSTSSLALNIRYASIFPFTSSFLECAFSMQSLVYSWGFRPESM